MVNYVCVFSQSETEKYFEWIISSNYWVRLSFMWRIMEVEEGVTCWGCKVEVDNTLLWYEDCTDSMSVIILLYYWMRLSIISRAMEIEGGVTCWGRKAKVDKGLRDLHNPSDDVIASLADVFRRARFSSLPTNACPTEDNIPFPCLANPSYFPNSGKLTLTAR